MCLKVTIALWAFVIFFHKIPTSYGANYPNHINQGLEKPKPILHHRSARLQRLRRIPPLIEILQKWSSIRLSTIVIHPWRRVDDSGQKPPTRNTVPPPPPPAKHSMRFDARKDQNSLYLGHLRSRKETLLFCAKSRKA